MKLRNPDNFKCQWCGNTVLAMTWSEIRGMLITYRAVEGSGTFQKISRETGITLQSLYWWADHDCCPSYESGRKLGMWLKAEFEEMERREINRFNMIYPYTL